MAPLLLRPFDPSSRSEQFAWRASMYHPTFKSHIPKTMLLQQVANTCCTPLTGWSMCHERSNPPPPALPYDHTHLALIFSTRINLEGPRKFDVAFASDPLNPQSIQLFHPNVQSATAVQMQQIVNEYHCGWLHRHATERSHVSGSTGRSSVRFGVDHVWKGPRIDRTGRGYVPKTAILHCTRLVGKRGSSGQTRRNCAAKNPRTVQRTSCVRRIW